MTGTDPFETDPRGTDPRGTDPRSDRGRDAFSGDAYGGPTPPDAPMPSAPTAPGAPTDTGARPGPTAPTGEDDLRHRAIGRIRGRRALVMSVIWWVIISSVLIWVWSRNGGFFWPIFPIGAWAIGIVWQLIDQFGRGETEDRIQAEMRRLAGSGR